MGSIFAILKTVFSIINLWLEKSKQDKLIEAGKALQFKEEEEAHAKNTRIIQNRLSSISDRDIDELLKPPSERKV